MRQARLTKAIKQYAEDNGIKIVKAKRYEEGKHKLIGIHLLRPTPNELENALETAVRDMFPAIIIHTFDSWAPGAMKQRQPKIVVSKASNSFGDQLLTYSDGSTETRQEGNWL